MRPLLSFLAARRPAGVGLALLAELGALAALSVASPATVIGIPAAVAAGIAGTVAVVFGVVDGVVLAALGAVEFAALGGFGAGELAAIGAWPAVVGAAGLFARRLGEHRRALEEVVRAQERERRKLALELHDDAAQTLTAALLALRAAGHRDGDPLAQAASAEAREQINGTIRALRDRAVDLSPKALEDYGLAPALEHLGEILGARVGVSVSVDAAWRGRLDVDAELALFRVVQETLQAALDGGARDLAVTLGGRGGAVAVEIAAGGELPLQAPSAPLRERLRLLGGRVSLVRTGAGGTSLLAELPLPAVAGSAGA